jgi:ribonuclease-3
VWIKDLWQRLRGGRRPLPTDIGAILEAFQQRINLRFQDQGLLRQALTHRSFLGSNGGDPKLSNERIEFLGDAVLELAVIEFLYRTYPEDREGSLTKKKGLLVSRDVLAQCAERMGLGASILLSEAEGESGGRSRASILSDTFESVIGAIYLDQGLPEARIFVRHYLLQYADSILQDQSLSNHKSFLQEHVQARYKTHPRYRVVTESGPDHMKLFTVEVSVRGTLLGRGQGHNKKEAEQMAARDAISKLSVLDKAATLGPGVAPPLGGAVPAGDPGMQQHEASEPAPVPSAPSPAGGLPQDG